MPITPSRELLDAGKRMADQVNGHLTMGNPFALHGKWMAFALEDGTTRGEVYDSLPDAKRFTDEWKTAYLCFTGVLGGTNAYECAIYLDFCRQAREANLGHRDPNQMAFMSTFGHDMMARRWQGQGVN